jgi:Na+/H+-dicarboxylate symporter
MIDFVLALFFYILFSVAVMILASNRGRSGFFWFVISLFISTLLAIIFLLVIKRIDPNAPSPATHVKCPDCKELVLKEANVCKHCGCKLIPAA